MSGKRHNPYKVYMWTNRANGLSYIGCTNQNLKNRSRHGAGYRGCRRFEIAINEYGWDSFELTILGSSYDREEALLMERQMIAKYKTNDPKYGYNMQSGGLKGMKFAEESKARMADTMRGRKFTDEHRRNMALAETGERNHEYGKKWSDERRALASKQRRTIRYPNKRYVSQYTLSGELVKVWDGVANAARSIGVGYCCISDCCRGHQKTCKGFTWKYSTQEEFEQWENL